MQVLRFLRRGSCGVGIVGLVLAAGLPATAQQSLTWDQVKTKLEAAHPALNADPDSVDEMQAEEITAYLRPIPLFTLWADGTQIAPHDGFWMPFKGTYEQPNAHNLEISRDRFKEAEAVRVRDGVTYSHEHGGASLMDFLNAQSDARQVQLADRQLIGAYPVSAGQLNLAVGREVMQ